MVGEDRHIEDQRLSLEAQVSYLENSMLREYAEAICTGDIVFDLEWSVLRNGYSRCCSHFPLNSFPLLPVPYAFIS